MRISLTMAGILITLILISAECFHLLTAADTCPEEYRRLSSKHSFCLPKDQSCKIVKRGTSAEDQSVILRTLNEYRNKVASGLETDAGGLPQASDMIMLVWDAKLGAIAQKWAEQCSFSHDCNDCRAVRDFPVGQNLYMVWETCNRGKCKAGKEKPDWGTAINAWNGEVKQYNKQNLDAFIASDATGHFTQDIWAKTRRVGCGFVAYTDKGNMNKYYVCNFGPNGNVLTSPVYQAGKACSACPTNSCCGKTCKGKNMYQALCQMLDPNAAPREKSERHLIDCSNLAHCDIRTGDGKWKLVSTLNGKILYVLLNSGETAKMELQKLSKTNQFSFCIIIRYRYGANVKSEKFASRLTLSFKGKNGARAIEIPRTQEISTFEQYSVQVSNDLPKLSYTIGLKFQALKGSRPQFLEIASITVDEGKCKLR